MRGADGGALLAALVAIGIVPAVATAATIEIVNVNAASTGFNDPTPANAAAGDNGATTLGQQRLRTVQRAAEIWAARLVSAVPIRVNVQMIPQPCDADGTTLASAGPVSLAANFPNAPRANTGYHIALANALAGRDLETDRNDINANFNLSIDAGCSATSVGWWYGLDAAVPVPADRVAMLPVALHELAHGLGFSAQVNTATGEFFTSSPPVWSNHLYDLEIMKHWRSMTASERALSARNDPFLVWTGSSTNGRLSGVLTGAPALQFDTVRGVRDDITELGLAQFGPQFAATPVAARVVLVNDGIAATGEPSGTVTDGCEAPFLNGNRLAGRIALIDRGLCPFVDKVRNAQLQGAVAVVIANNVDGPPPGMAGSDPSITIPAVAVSRDVGARMKRSLLRPQLQIAFGLSDGLAGVAQGCLRMFAPDELEPGSSVSHFHPTAFPDLLMEPSISRALFTDLDLSTNLMRDIGWLLADSDPTPSGTDDCVTGPLP